MVTAFVSGCYDLLHGGHIEFLQSARALGDRLVVCLPTDEVVEKDRGRRPSLPLEQKITIFRALRMVDEVVVGGDLEPGMNFRPEFLRLRPDLLVAGGDDKYVAEKRALCAETGARYLRVSKSVRWPNFSTSQLVARLSAPRTLPLRVDFAGGWLDVPHLATQGGFVVNCAISPLFEASRSPYEIMSGLGGSAAYAIANGESGVGSELGRGVGWQDPAVIEETGLCVWRSGGRPVLEWKSSGESLLSGCMALWWTGQRHQTVQLVDIPRDYQLIRAAGMVAASAARQDDRFGLAKAIEMSYAAQRDEGMEELPEHDQLARKYCGSGWGGYALYLFGDRKRRDAFIDAVSPSIAIEPFTRQPS